jgi:hypothetical protein
VPAVTFASVGHAAELPVQLSATSHTPAAARHTVALDRKASVGHAVLLPVHVSATSHGPAAARQVVPALPARCEQMWSLLQVSVVHGFPSSVQAYPVGRFASAGHATFVPSHVSATSQSFAAARHTVPALTFASAGHAAELPVQLSARSHTPAAARHTVALDRKASVGHAVLLPVHVSATSHGPAAARQVAPALPAAWAQLPLPSHKSVVHGLPSSVQA